jgi:hypothetical protein
LQDRIEAGLRIAIYTSVELDIANSNQAFVSCDAFEGGQDVKNSEGT